ncbi:MAG: hypothetical protein ACK4HW_09265 [Roseinatronobacter sp.]
MTWILALLGLGFAYALLEWSSDDAKEFRDEDADRESDTPDDRVIGVANNTISDETDGADSFQRDPALDGFFTARLNGGAGDVVLRLSNRDGTAKMFDVTVDGGRGIDVIDVDGESTTVSGGDGNDTIVARLTGGLVNEDAGDDVIRVRAGASTAVIVDGGSGADRIGVSGSANVIARGGLGDDIIVTDGTGDLGAGFNIVAEGGPGNDTFLHSLNIAVLPDLEANPAIMCGGESADLFRIALTGGGDPIAPNPDGTVTCDNRAGLIEDFSRDEDRLEIDLTQTSPLYSAIDARLVEQTAIGATDIVLDMPGSTHPVQQIVIRVGTTGLQWADISFIGRNASLHQA